MRSAFMFLQRYRRFYSEQSGYGSDNYFKSGLRKSGRLHEKEECVPIEMHGRFRIFIFVVESTGHGRLG